MSNSKRPLVKPSAIELFQLKKLRADITWQGSLKTCLKSALDILDDALIIGREVNSSGARKFGATNLETFYNYYSSLSAENKTCYEIIRKGCPVKFYLDIDCVYDSVNDTFKELVTPDKVVSSLNWYLTEILKSMGIITAERIVDNVIVLDACSPEKFSLHLIYPDIVFPSIEHCMALVRWLINLLYEVEYPIYENDGLTGQGVHNILSKTGRMPLLIPYRDVEDLHFLFDVAVYNANQNFMEI
ncbi:hypothetical protein O9G_004989 [Rozella allomycis CSF55]|uniref:DNA-directed primase/polymerase protein n=1 Tax=Rozella allomycis (strain CSF55) TaxID=988480 RepID=A0A075AZB2_ROZAC|nr:hypothetical protein O9G_004989 [Rozella allomycis CSF55]|eukprot:EPZ34052.1 hypothetical protein O9G_004989 [Rozella allomycis CSF55]